jgi:D-alanyl-D-alanine dipeptidase
MSLETPPKSDSYNRREILAFLLSLAVSGCKKRRIETPLKVIHTPKRTKPVEPAKEVKEVKNPVTINGVQIGIEDIKKLDEPLKNEKRIIEYPTTDEAVEIIKQMSASEGFAKVEDYKIGGESLMLRETAAKLYKLAQKYAAMEGYGLAIFSAYRDFKKQRQLYRRAGKRDKGGMVAKIKDSQHVRGGAMDVLLYQKKDGKVRHITPTKAKPDRGTQEDIERFHKYLQLAGFANYTVEPWHNEAGSEEWVEIMIQKGIFTKEEYKSRLYTPVKRLPK